MIVWNAVRPLFMCLGTLAFCGCMAVPSGDDATDGLSSAVAGHAVVEDDFWSAAELDDMIPIEAWDAPTDTLQARWEDLSPTCQQATEHVKTVVARSCLDCHGQVPQSNAMNKIDQFTSLVERGLVVPGRPYASPFMRRLLWPDWGDLSRDGDRDHPPAWLGQVAHEDLQVISYWILCGAAELPGVDDAEDDHAGEDCANFDPECLPPDDTE